MNIAKIEISQGSSAQCFPDVDVTAWYSPYICTANSLGIAKGFSSGKF
ncbi:MAG: S-layer homology domain-containing protein [Patescibacteria group bacterium]